MNYYLLKYILLTVTIRFTLFFIFYYFIIYFREFYRKTRLSNPNLKSICEWMRIRFPSPFVCILCLYKITISIRRVADALASGNSEFNYVYRVSVFGRPLGFSNRTSIVEWNGRIKYQSKWKRFPKDSDELEKDTFDRNKILYDRNKIFNSAKNNFYPCI